MLSEIPTELYYEERAVFGKRLVKSDTWTFKLGVESGNHMTSWVTVRFLEKKTVLWAKL